ncbi:MAG: type II toxin-antitoxin system VapC family toxin, partial [Actinomycetota bacterium]
MIVLDTTILVYSVGTTHPLADPCRRLIDAIGDGQLAATTTPQVIQEFVQVRARRRGRGDAVDLGRRFVLLLTPLLQISEPDL